MDSSTFHGPGMEPTATWGQAIYADAGTVDAIAGASTEPRTARRSARANLYQPFHYVLLVYLFLYCSRITELIPHARLGLILQPILLIGLIMTGRAGAILRMPMGKLMIAFTVWVAICAPFSVWRGGSFTTFLITLQALLLIAFIAAFVQIIPDCLRVMYTVAVAMAVVGVLSLVLGGGTSGRWGQVARLGLGEGANTLADANLLCLYILVGLPFLWLSASLKTGLKKVLLMSLTIPMFAGAARTGSRMGLLALVTGLLLFLIFASAKQRLMVITGGAALLMMALFFLPEGIKERFTTYFQAQSVQSEEAAQSALARKELLLRSLELTAEHPFLGVGPGEFIDAEAAEAEKKGQKALWHYTHNSYTELSSETGIVGLVLFVIVVFRAYKGLSPIRSKNRSATVRRAALFTQMVVLMTAVGAFFLSIAYGGIVVVVIAISGTLQVAVLNQARLDRLRNQ